MVRRILAWLLSTLLVTATDWFLSAPDEWSLQKGLLLGAIISTIIVGINWYQQRSKKRE